MLLKEQKCSPCRSDETAMTVTDITRHLKDLDGWKVLSLDDTPRLQKTYCFSSYLKGLDFVRTVAEMAEDVDHHPIMEMGWREVTVRWWTHNINGLHLNDFIMAARCDEVVRA